MKKLAKLHPRKKNLWARKKAKIPPEKIPKVPEKKKPYIYIVEKIQNSIIKLFLRSQVVEALHFVIPSKN